VILFGSYVDVFLNFIYDWNWVYGFILFTGCVITVLFCLGFTFHGKFAFSLCLWFFCYSYGFFCYSYGFMFFIFLCYGCI